MDITGKGQQNFMKKIYKYVNKIKYIRRGQTVSFK